MTMMDYIVILTFILCATFIVNLYLYYVWTNVIRKNLTAFVLGVVSEF